MTPRSRPPSRQVAVGAGRAPVVACDRPGWGSAKVCRKATVVAALAQAGGRSEVDGGAPEVVGLGENETDLPIREHATDTHGAALVNFGLFDQVGTSLTPRVRDLGKITNCCRSSPPATARTSPSSGSSTSTSKPNSPSSTAGGRRCAPPR
ncbi:Tn3 family transposase [Streptosporangium canum]|uniref:Tn3 family transposase n=1 Tax=Streptosporangium canum TaxID=324952 RepID=UPI0037BD0045